MLVLAPLDKMTTDNIDSETQGQIVSNCLLPSSVHVFLKSHNGKGWKKAAYMLE